MATVHFGRLLGAAGFARTVAVKRLHPQFARDPEFVSMFVDEARMAARIRHPNVVQTLDVVQLDHEIFLVMDYVHGESLANLLKRAQARGQKVPLGIAIKIIQHALFGLHAAHDAKSELGEPLDLVHRDLSPHNVLVGVDGVARVLDFGIAKAGGRVQVTRDGQVKGKLSYFSPEQLNNEHPIDRRADVYAASATLWEAITGRRLVQGESDWQRVTQICAGLIAPPSSVDPTLPPELDAILMKGLARIPSDRFATAREMAHALDKVGPPASAGEVGEWVEVIGGDSLRKRADHVASIESQSVAIAAPLTAEDPTLTRSEPGLILAESSANHVLTGRAAMARTLNATPSGPRGTLPSVTTDSGARSARTPVTVPPSALDVELDEAPPRRRRGWVLVPLLLLLAGGACVFYMNVNGLLPVAWPAAGDAPRGDVAAAAPHVPSPQLPSNGGAAAAHPAAHQAAEMVAPLAETPAAPIGAAAGAANSANGAAGASSGASSGANSGAGAAASAPTVWKPWKPWQPASAAGGAAPSSGASASSAPITAASIAATPKPSAAASNDCDVPYTIDSQGIRHPKPQCL
jgi:serine/threonine-protein kinase